MPRDESDYTVEAPDPSVGQICLEFDSKEELIRCLDVVSELGGLGCEVVPWKLVIGPASLDTICEKRGVRARVIKIAPSHKKLSPRDQEEVSAAMLRAGKALEAASRGQ